MRKTLCLATLLFALICLQPGAVLAQKKATPSAALKASPSPTLTLPIAASDSATTSGVIASPSAVVEQKIQEKQASDITDTSGKQKDILVSYLDAHPIQPLTWHNFLQHAIRDAISNGLPANIIVLLILFPIIASIIAASRHLIGLQGFGIYIPAVLSVAFVSTGLITGIAIFVVVLLAATILRLVLKRLQLQYLPRTALLLWGVSLAVLCLLLLATIYGISGLLSINIFPILIIILLTENFMETQLTSSQTQALELTAETLVIAVICSLIISSQTVQEVVLLRPELTFLLVAIFNVVTGHYSGLRLLEYIRFRSIIES